MSACTPPDHAAFESGAARGVTPPLLPTLMMAVILGAASYLCHEPAAVAPPALGPGDGGGRRARGDGGDALHPGAPRLPDPVPHGRRGAGRAAPAAQAHKAGPRPARIAAARRVETAPAP